MIVFNRLCILVYRLDRMFAVIISSGENAGEGLFLSLLCFHLEKGVTG